MGIVEDEGILIGETDEELKNFMQNESFIHYVSHASRPGIGECLTLLEFRDYKPGTPRNDLFIMRIIEWEGLTYIAVSIPIDEKHLMEKAVEETDLKIADGVPTMMGGGEVNHFPMCNKRVFTLENTSGHPVYRNDPEVNDALRESESESMARIRKIFS